MLYFNLPMGDTPFMIWKQGFITYKRLSQKHSFICMIINTNNNFHITFWITPVSILLQVTIINSNILTPINEKYKKCRNNFFHIFHTHSKKTDLYYPST